MEGKAAVTIGGRQVGLALAPRAPCSLSACDAREWVARPSWNPPRPRNQHRRHDLLWLPRRVCIDYRRTYHRQKWNGLTFSRRRGGSPSSSSYARYASRCVDALEFRRTITRREQERGKVRRSVLRRRGFTTTWQFASHLPESAIFPREIDSIGIALSIVSFISLDSKETTRPLLMKVNGRGYGLWIIMLYPVWLWDFIRNASTFRRSIEPQSSASGLLI